VADDPPTPDVERGVALDRYQIFGDWDEQHWLWNKNRPTDTQLERMFERDGKARQTEQALTLPLRQATLRFHGGKGDRGELELVEQALTTPANAGGMSTPLWQVLGQATSAVAHRRAFFEKVWAERDGRLTYDKLAWRPQNSCEIVRDKTTGAFDGFRQYVGHDHPGADPQGRVTIKARDAWVFLHGAHRDPLHGISDFDVVWNNHVTKQKIKFLYFALFLENAALPKTAVGVPNSDDKRDAARKIAGLKNNGVAGVSDAWKFTHFPIGDGKAFQDALGYLDADSAASVLAGFTNLTDPAKTGGSYALSKDATDFFLMAEQAKLTELAGSLTSFVAADLVKWNFGPSGTVPTLEFEQLAYEDVKTSLDALTSLAAARGQGVPAEFIDELVVRVSGMLELPVDKIRQAVEQAQAQVAQASPAGAAPAGQLGAAVGRVANPLAARITADQTANLNAVAR
jgi:hypothetical protein